LERFNAQVDLLRKTGRISAGQAQYAKSWATRQPGAVGEHRVTAESKRIADKWFGGAVLTDAGRKLRARGSQFYLSDH
jgi:ribosomal protein L3